MKIKRVNIFKIFLLLNLLKIGSGTITQTYSLHNCKKSDLLKITKKEHINDLTLNNCELKKLTANELAGFEKLARLNVVSSELTKLQSNVFNNLKQLRYLNLAKNQLNHVDNWATEPLIALQILDLSENSLKALPNESFENFKNLQILNLNGNRIELLNSTSLHSLNYLSELNLANNALKEVNASDFSALPYLSILHLNHNQIEIVASEAFQENTKLKTLDLCNNKLKDIKFLPIRNLKQLNLSHNQIEQFKPKTFETSSELVELNLSFNFLDTITSDVFQGLSSLEFLALSHNKLQNLSIDCFAALKSLKKIKLDLNNLKTLPVNIFDELKLLEYIDLSNNDLKALNRHIFKELPFLVEVKLAHNQLTDLDFTLNFAKALQINQLTLDLSENLLRAETFDLSFLAKFKTVNLAENIWSCTWLIKALFEASRSIRFGSDFQTNAWRLSSDIQNLNGLSCFDKNRNRSILLLNLTTAQNTLQHHQNYVETAKICHCETPHKHLNPSPPPVVWPKLYMDKFDSRSVIIWMLIAIAIAFTALRIGRQFLEKNDRKRRFMRKFMPQQNQNTELEVLRFEDNVSSRNSASDPYQQLPNNTTLTVNSQQK